MSQESQLLRQILNELKLINKTLKAESGAGSLQEAVVVLTQIQQQVAPVKLYAELIEILSLTKDGEYKKVDKMFLKASDKLPLKLAVKDKYGNKAELDGKPQWALTNESVGSLVVSDDGMSAEFSPNGVSSAFKVQVSADADLGEGVKSLLAELELEVLAGEAVSLELSAGESVPSPEPSPEPAPSPEPQPEPVPEEAAPVEGSPV
jgi:hypothetical protein